MRKLFILSIFSAIAFACSNGRFSGEAAFELEGTLENAASTQLLFEELTTNNLIPVDTVTTDDQGYFSLSGNIDSPGFFILRVDRSNFITLLLEPGEKLKIAGDANNLPLTYQVEGSEGSQLLADLNKAKHQSYRKIDSLAGIFREIQAEDNFLELRQEVDLAYSKVFEQQQQYVMDFIDKHSNSLASIIALYQFFGNQVLLKESEHFEYFEKLSSSLSEVYPGNKHVVDLTRRVNEWKRSELQRQEVEQTLAVGNMAPEVVMPDPEGNNVALSALRGKVVLIDFWAAWCNPCRLANSKLKEFYDNYRGQGFEIYGISLDRNREQWLQGIREDKIDWIQVSDLRFWNSPVVSLYNVEAIPYNVLIDREGRIMARGLSMQQLEELLAETFR